MIILYLGLAHPIQPLHRHHRTLFVHNEQSIYRLKILFDVTDVFLYFSTKCYSMYGIYVRPEKVDDIWQMFVCCLVSGISMVVIRLKMTRDGIILC